MRTSILSILLLSLAAGCDDGDDTGATTSASSGGAHSTYGSCGNTIVNIVSAEDLGEPIAYTVEIDNPSGWVPVALTPDQTSSPVLYRTDDGGLWLRCPTGSTQWHVGWISA